MKAQNRVKNEQQKSNNEIAKGETIGAASDRLAEEYFNLFLSLSDNRNLSIKNRAEGLAIHDLLVKKLVYGSAVEKLKEKIKFYIEGV